MLYGAILTIIQDLRDRNHRYLKYTVRLYKSPAVTPDQKVRRQYVSAGILGEAPSRPNVRKMEILEIPETGDWPPVDNTWATLAPINTHTRVERLSTTKAIIGRYEGNDAYLKFFRLRAGCVSTQYLSNQDSVIFLFFV